MEVISHSDMKRDRRDVCRISVKNSFHFQRKEAEVCFLIILCD